MKYLLLFEAFASKEEKKEYYRNLAASRPVEERIHKPEDLKKYNLPDEIIEIMSGWEVILKSPYSNTFYNSLDISWTHKPDGSFRVSDHWNFRSGGDEHIHCKTDKPVKNVEYVSLGQYDKKNRVYKILLTLPTPEFIQTLLRREERSKYLKSPEVIKMKQEFKSRVKSGEVFGKITKDGKDYEGIVKKYTGFELSMDNEGDRVFNSSDVKYNDPVYLYDKDGNEIENPFKKFFNGQLD